jgi:predicted RNA-binding protein YlqC (UPF0109 family)
MQELVETLVKALVDHPEDVVVNRTDQNSTVLLEMKVNSDDIGKVIGRQGRVIKALRTVVRSCGVRDGVRVNLELNED